MSVASGRRLGIYVIEGQLGAGGMGEVYKARDERLRRTVAIKFILQTQDEDEEYRARFLQEARAASALNHPNIVTIHEIGTDNGRDYLVMEYLSGRSLDELIPRQGLRFNLAVNYGLQISKAMCAAYNAGIVHRDLKPANVMVLENGLVKVLDFGLAKSIATHRPSDTTLTALPLKTQQGSIIGTAAYMSPEQAEGDIVDARSDIFSFGCMFYEMLTGISPFRRSSAISSMTAVLRDEPKPLSEVAKDLPAGAENIIHRCLQKNRNRRIQSWADLRVLLEELKEESEQPGPAFITKKKQPPKASFKRTMWATGAAASLVAAVVIYHHRRPPTPAPPLANSLLASLPGFLSHPNLSPDGNRVAFAWDGGTGGLTQIYLKVIGEGAPFRLTNGTAYASVPVWSSDGTNIAFMSSTENNAELGSGGKSDVKPMTAVDVISALGGDVREIASYRAHPRDMSWSADEKSAIVSTDNAVYAISVENRARKKIVDAPPNHVYRAAKLSPDGHTLALIDAEGSSEARAEAHIELLDIGEDGSATDSPRSLKVGQVVVDSIEWTANSKALVFSGAQSMDANSLWRIPINGDPETGLDDVGSGSLAPSIVGPFGRHGGRMVYVHVVADTDIWKVALEKGKAGALTPLIASTKREWDPRYSPDGKKIIFTSDQGGSTDIWVANADGYGMTQVTTLKGNGTGGARWSPDGKQIAFISKVDGQWEIFMSDAQGGSPVRITNNPAHDTAPMWSPDGKWIYFASDRSGQFEIWKTLPKENATPIQVTHHGGYSTIFSADGNTMYYSKKDPAEGIWKQALVDGEPSGEESQLLPIHLSNWGNFDVSRDGIAYVPAEQGAAHIYFYRFANRSTTKLATLAGTPDFGISISPVDGSVLFTQVTKPRRELVLVDNFQ
jgi:eukaryotic-like serine/threonine-protein kinase